MRTRASSSVGKVLPQAARRQLSSSSAAKKNNGAEGRTGGKRQKAPAAKEKDDSETFDAPYAGVKLDIPHTPNGLEFIARLVAEFDKHRDANVAKRQAMYTKDKFFYFGIKAPEMRKITKDVLKECPRLEEEDVASAAAKAFEHRERELHLAAIDLLVQSPLSIDLPTAKTFISTASWWDSVDMLAINVVGPIVSQNRDEGSAVMRAWVADPHLWVRRAAVLHQLHYKEATDLHLLLHTCTAVMAEKDFFSRKAVGWALRHYSRTDAAAVRRFCAEHAGQLSALSLKEATRLLPEHKP